jgi:hypothetical protein
MVSTTSFDRATGIGPVGGDRGRRWRHRRRASDYYLFNFAPNPDESAVFRDQLTRARRERSTGLKARESEMALGTGAQAAAIFDK